MSWADIQHVLTESEENADKEPGWIIGTIAMKWPIRDPKIMLQDPSKKQHLEIMFTKASMMKLNLSIEDTIKLSLRNTRLELKRGGSSVSKIAVLAQVFWRCRCYVCSKEWQVRARWQRRGYIRVRAYATFIVNSF